MYKDLNKMTIKEVKLELLELANAKTKALIQAIPEDRLKLDLAKARLESYSKNRKTTFVEMNKLEMEVISQKLLFASYLVENAKRYNHLYR